MDFQTPLNIALMLIGNTLCVLAVVTPVNGLALLFACWLYNHLAGVYDAPRKAAAGQSSPPLKTTDAGPYTAPGADSSLPVLSDSAGVPIPDFGRFAAIALCGAVAKVAIVGGAFALETAGPGSTFFPGILLGSLPVMFFSVSGIYAAMLPTTYPRAMLLYLLGLLPIVGIGIAFSLACLSMLPKSFH